MVSSLASQLQVNVSLNAALLDQKSKSGKRNAKQSKKRSGERSESYLFAGRDAAAHDLDSVYALGFNGLLSLRTLNPELFSTFLEDGDEKYERLIGEKDTEYFPLLFSARAKNMDRTLMTEKENTQLSAAIETFLRRLGPFILDAPAGKTIEWLVKRYRINEFNIDEVLSLFLPYHESPHFAKILTILHIKENTRWSFLIPYCSTGKSPPRNAIVSAMVKDTDLARFIAQMVTGALKYEVMHRALVCFHMSAILEFIRCADELDHGTIAYLLPTLLKQLEVTDEKIKRDCTLASYVMLAGLSQKCKFTTEALKTVVTAVIRSGKHVDSSQMLTALLSILNPQQETITLSKVTVNQFFDSIDILQAVEVSSSWVGMEKLLTSVAPEMIQRIEDEKTSKFLESLLSASSASDPVIACVSEMLLACLIADEKENGEKCFEILAMVHQRHPKALQASTKRFVAENVDNQRIVDQLLLKLSLPTGTVRRQNIAADAVLNATDAVADVRSIAVREIQRKLNDEDLNDEEKISLQEVLKARIWDTDIAVLQALYEMPRLLLPSISDVSFIRSFAEYLTMQEVTRPLLRLHINFFCHDYCVANPSLRTPLLLHILFPFIIFTKPRHKSVLAVWEILDTSPMAQHELLKSTTQIIQIGEKKEKATEQLASLNGRLTYQIAENLCSSDNRYLYLEWLYTELRSGDSHRCILSWLIVHGVLDCVSEKIKIDVAVKVLDSLSPNSFGDICQTLSNVKFSESFYEEDILRNVVTKPNSQTTIYRLQATVLLKLAAIQNHAKEVTNWFIRSSNSFDKGDVDNTPFLCLARLTYTMSNLTPASSVLTVQVNQALFTALASNSLMFLASIWTDPKHGVDIDCLRYTSLKHGAAFFKAHKSSGPLNFQCIIPAVISTLSASDSRVRRAAADCIEALLEISSAIEPKEIYAYDQIYGNNSSSLQYLDWQDVCEYIRCISEHRDYLINDENYVSVLHQEQLSHDVSDSKKKTKYKQRILCFLTSHISSCSNAYISVRVLSTIRNVKDITKLLMLLPAAKAFLSDVEHCFNDLEISEFLCLLVPSFDASAAKNMNSTESELFTIFLLYLKRFQPTGLSDPVWLALSKQLESEMFDVLSESRRHEICNYLLDLGSSNGDHTSSIKKLLAALTKRPKVTISLLVNLRPKSTDGGFRSVKRIKVDSSLERESNKDDYTTFIYLAEILSSQSLPGSLELVTCLLETLHVFVSASAEGNTDLSYLEQLLMTCIESSSSKIEEPPNLAKSTIRLDILVELMRVAGNPQTFHQALLLMATLARIAPESVLHNVMPVFTFMGSNVFHRDDTYSFGVIKKTIENIVPIMANSLRLKHTTTLGLYIDSREFLRVFTEASNHVPRHRRTNFFTHFVDVLGPSDFLAAVCMLLVNKASNRITRQEMDKSHVTLALPLAVLRHYPVQIQITALTESLKECQRLIHYSTDPAVSNENFLTMSSEDEASTPINVLRQRQCRAILIFVGYSAQQIRTSQQDYVASTDMITQLLELLIKRQSIGTYTDELDLAARWALFRCLSYVSTNEFSGVILEILQTDDIKMQQGALDLLCERLHAVKSQAREQMSTAMIKIIDVIKKILTHSHESGLIVSTLKALSAIVSSSCSPEEASLTETIPLILQITSSRLDPIVPLSTLPMLISRLGPMILPHFRNIIDVCVNVVKLYPSRLDVQDEIVNVFFALSKSIPAFLGGSELQSIINFYLNGFSGSSKARIVNLMKLIAKRTQGTILLPTLCQMWASLRAVPTQHKSERAVKLFGLVQRSLHASTRADVLNEMRPLMELFTTALNCRTDLIGDVKSIENAIIAAFLELVAKLNEATFRPLFRRLYDWAFTNDSPILRRITFFRLYTALLDLFKNLMVPYMTYLTNAIIEQLQSYDLEMSTDTELWHSLIETLSKSFTFDEGAFWQLDRLRRISGPIVKQIPVCVRLKSSLGKSILPSCISSMADVMADTSLLKLINLDILMHTRSENVRIRILALICSISLWQRHGQQLSGFASETATFILECAEDESDDVIKESHNLKNAVEAVSGRIEGL